MKECQQQQQVAYTLKGQYYEMDLWAFNLSLNYDTKEGARFFLFRSKQN